MQKIFLYGDSIKQGWCPALRAATCGQWDIRADDLTNGERMVKLRDYTAVDVNRLYLQQFAVYVLQAGIWDATDSPPTAPNVYGMYCWNAINNIRTVSQKPIILATSTSFTGDTAGMIQQYNDTLKGGAPYFTNVSILDLYAYQKAQNLGQTVDGKHFTEQSYAQLAEQVRSAIAAKLV